MALLLAALAGDAVLAVGRDTDSMAQALSYPYASQLASADRGDAIAWVVNREGVRNIWVARGPAFQPRQATRYSADDGQELTQLTYSPDGSRLVFVRGGDHDANWPAEGNLQPNPGSALEAPSNSIWSLPLTGGEPQLIDEGDDPVISVRGQLAYVKDHHVWSILAEGAKPERLFFDRGSDGDLQWSPDGSRLAFVSNRTDHGFIGIYSGKEHPLIFLAPSTNLDESPRWSPDGLRVAFTRRAGEGGAPEPLLKQVAHPWSIWIATVDSGVGKALWGSPATLLGSFPDAEGGVNLMWMGEHLTFSAYLDAWPHLYSLPVMGGTPLLLTPGAFMVEHVVPSRDRRHLIYDANGGATAGDGDRRHLYRVSVERADAVALTQGQSIDWTPVSAAAERVAYIASEVSKAPHVALVGLNGQGRHALNAGTAVGEATGIVMITPKPVTFKASDGLLVHGQLFDALPSSGARRPAVIFLHGGPPRQMLLGWHYMDYYSNAYAVNQYLAAHGFVVLAVNYRLGIGYGFDFHHPEQAGPSGAAEYQDVLAGAHYLQGLANVDGARIGLWGGSYGGYLTALALARDSELFKAGVDLHGVHDWSQLLDEVSKPATRFERGDRDKALEVAFTSSPVASMQSWTSPVLLIQGDDDRNVPFHQTVDLARRLEAGGVAVEELVLPNEIHGFLRHASWLRADAATVEFLTRTLKPKAP